MAPPPLPLLQVRSPPQTVKGGRRRSKSSSSVASSSTPPAPICATEAKNVFTFPLDAGKQLEALRQLTDSLRPSAGQKSMMEARGKYKQLRFHAEKPSWKSDIQWVSARDALTFDFFKRQFATLGIAERLAFLGEMRMLSGFFVLRQTTRKSHFHTDFGETGGKCFTLMTPLHDMSALVDCHLACAVPMPIEASGDDEASEALRPPPLDSPTDSGVESSALPAAEDEHEAWSESAAEYADDASMAATADALRARGLVLKQYRYQVGEAIVFGDGFEHATQTGSAPRPLAFLCFTMGAADCTPQQWAAAEGYISEQGPVYADPAGTLIVRGVAAAAG